MEAKKEEKDAGQNISDSVRQAISNLRDTAKWILTILAAVGAVLAAGVQLTTIGQLKLSDPRLWTAVVAAVVVLLAIGLAISRVVRVLTTGHMTLDSLVEEERKAGGPSEDVEYAKQVGFLYGYDTVREFRKDYREAKRKLSEAEQNNNQQQIGEWSPKVKRLGEQIMPQFFDGVRYYRVRRHFREAVWWLLGCGFVAALGIMTFAWAANPAPAAASPSLFRTPVEASVQLTDVGRTTLASSLGENCVDSPIRVIILSASEQRMDVVSMPTDECEVFRFPVVDGVTGSVQPEDSVQPSG